MTKFCYFGILVNNFYTDGYSTTQPDLIFFFLLQWFDRANIMYNRPLQTVDYNNE